MTRSRTRTIVGHTMIWFGLLILIGGLVLYTMDKLRESGVLDAAEAEPLVASFTVFDLGLPLFVGGFLLMGGSAFVLRKTEEIEQAHQREAEEAEAGEAPADSEDGGVPEEGARPVETVPNDA